MVYADNGEKMCASAAASCGMRTFHLLGQAPTVVHLACAVCRRVGDKSPWVVSFALGRAWYPGNARWSPRVLRTTAVLIPWVHRRKLTTSVPPPCTRPSALSRPSLSRRTFQV